MNDIPTFIEFNPQDKNNSINDDLNSSFNTSLPELDSFNNDNDEYDPSITDQDLIDMKAMVRDLKSNPSLIYEKFSLPMVNESMVFGGNGGPNSNNISSANKGCTTLQHEMPSPQPRTRPLQYCQECESPNTLSSDFPKIDLKTRDLFSFPRLPVS